MGKQIFDLRKEKGLTQRQLADAMNISDKTISKWERGVGCPDVSLLKLYAEQGTEVHLPKIRGGKIYFYCSQHGLMENMQEKFI